MHSKLDKIPSVNAALQLGVGRGVAWVLIVCTFA